MVRRLRAGSVLLAVAVLLAACGGGGDGGGAGGAGAAAQNAGGGAAGTESEIEFVEGDVTMWARDVDEAFYQGVVDAWNESHDQQIGLTIIPTDQYIARIGTAAAGGDVPDLLSVDLIYMPQFIDSGLMLDITDRLAEAGVDDLSQGHLDIASADGRNYGTPFYVDSSSMFWNKALFEQAGLDPEKPPTSWQEIREYAEAIRGLGDDTYGFYFAGNCTGCNAYTMLPMVWAQGGQVLNEDGTEATLQTPEMEAALNFYREMWEADLIPQSANSDAGENWLTAFAAGDVGIFFAGSFAINGLPELNPDLEFGVAPIPGPDGGQSSFAGGDVIGIPAEAQNQDAAWEFIEWTLQEDTQREAFAGNGGLVIRTGLTEAVEGELRQENNTYLEFAQTPYALGYNEMFNDANGPWLAMIRTAVIDGDVEGAMADAQQRFDQIIADTTGG